MENRRIWLLLVILTGLMGLLLMGCATAPSNGPTAKSQADLLKEAGFRVHSAQDAHVAYIKTLPANKVVLNQYQSKPLYLVCTDPEAKSCYLGDRAAYDRYKQLAIQNSLSQEQQTVHEQRWDPEALQMWVDSQGGG